MKINKSLILTALSYSIYPAVIILLSHPSLDVTSKFLIGFALVFAKESLTWASLLVYFGPKEVFSRFGKKIRTRKGFINALLGILGGPVGYILLTISAIFIGGAISSLIMGLQIPLTLLLESIYLKKKISKNIIIGSIITFMSLTALVIINYDLFAGDSTNMILGSILSVITVFLWSFESIYMDYLFNQDDSKDISPRDTISLKLTSSVIFLIVALPIASLIFSKHIIDGYSIYINYLTHINSLVIFIIVAIFMLIARLSYLYSISSHSSTVTTIYYSISTFLTPIIILSFKYVFKLIHSVDNQITSRINFYVIILMFTIGSIISSLPSSEEKKENI